jgi:hypothetical protein
MAVSGTGTLPGGIEVVLRIAARFTTSRRRVPADCGNLPASLPVISPADRLAGLPFAPEGLNEELSMSFDR